MKITARAIKFNITINKQVLFLTFLIIPHMKPGYFDTVGFMDTLFNAWRILSFLLACFIVVLKRIKLSPVTILICIMCLFLFFNTLVKGENVYNCFTQCFPIVSIALIYEAYSDSPWDIIKSLYYCFEILLYINLISILTFPGGMYSTLRISVRNYFLGYYNAISKYYYPALVVSLLFAHRFNKTRAFLLIAVIYASIMITWSGGTLVSVVAVFFVYIFCKGYTSLFNYYTYWLLNPVFFICVILLRLQNYLYWLFNDVLGKWKSFIWRMNLWDWTIDKIIRSPWTGFGIISGDERALQYGNIWVGHAHNLILELFFEGGLVYFVLFVAIVIISGRKIYILRNTYYAQVISLGFLAWSIHNMVEPLVSPFLMGTFLLAYYCGNLIEEEKRETDVAGYDNRLHIILKATN